MSCSEMSANKSNNISLKRQQHHTRGFAPYKQSTRLTNSTSRVFVLCMTLCEVCPWDNARKYAACIFLDVM
jgi:hypothetical protein